MGKVVGLRNKKCEMADKPQSHLAYHLSGRHGKGVTVMRKKIQA